MHIRPIRTDADHEAALREIESLWGADEGTEGGASLLAVLAFAGCQLLTLRDKPEDREHDK